MYIYTYIHNIYICVCVSLSLSSVPDPGPPQNSWTLPRILELKDDLAPDQLGYILWGPPAAAMNPLEGIISGSFKGNYGVL